MAALYVYFTNQCKVDAETHGVYKDVEKLAQKLEAEQTPRGLEHFPPPYLKKCMGKHGRLVIEEHRNGDDTVLCFTRYFIRGNSEYDAFYRDTSGYYEKNKVPKEDIEVFLEERKKQPILHKEPLSDIESAYLQYTSASNYKEDGAFMESYDWFERISQNWAKDYLSRYYDLIVEIEEKIESDQQTIISHDKNNNIKILYRRFSDQKRTFLIAPIDPKKPNDEVELRKKYKNILDVLQVDHEEIVRCSRRAYPSIITYDETIWVRVQNSLEANLALSPEEEDILESVLIPKNDGPKYPLFINGRPGSGKSTILQYLFSEHLDRHIECNGKNAWINPPLYLTYSTPLLEQARSSVQNILICGHKTLQDGRELQDDTDLDKTLMKSFRNFREFLLDQLPVEVKETFVAANYVDFDQFRKKWDAKRSKHPEQDVRKIGPELAWHAIRTFIKGMRHESDNEIDPEFYEIELARDSKSISDAVFKSIYQHVWKNWYEQLCIEEGYWDDQDLAYAVLEHSVHKLSHYPAVFCDEAQDFTCVELDLIQRLSLYSQRELPSYLVKHVPFAFAGDPFQTLNPTGFNWDSMQSSFHENIVQQLDVSGNAKLEFNFQELSFNYRSSEYIVKLANLIQLLRAVLLRIKGLRPQQTWTRKATVSPVWFSRDDVGCQGSIREQDELVIIIPCQENGELEYVQSDSFLSTIALNNGLVSRNILSPAGAKGLEYDRVLLYGFGDEVRKRVPELLRHIDDPDQDPPNIERRLGWEYFLNQFYVAVSRARKRLFIVDSDEALAQFWVFTESKKQRTLLELYGNSQKWSLEDVGGTMKGDNSSWSDDRDDPLELAQGWKSQGFAQRDPYKLNLAKLNFERANRPEEAKLCQAAFHEFSEEFAKAGELFKKIRQADDACRCYWAGKDANAVISLVQEFPEIANDPRFLAASAIIQEKNTAGQIANLLNVLETVNPMPFPEGPGEIAAWRWFFEKFITKVSYAIESSERENSDWKPSVECIVTTLRRLGISSKSYPDVAKLYYLVGDANSALTHWAECTPDRKQQEPDWMIRLRAKTESYPANISYYDKLNDHNAIISAWRDNSGIISKETPVNLILKSATKEGDIAVIRELLPACNDVSRILDVIQAKGGSGVSELKGAIPVAIVHWLEMSKEWGNIVNFAITQKTPDKQLNDKLKSLNFQWEQEVTIAAAVRVLARSEKLADENSKAQQAISEFLKQSLIIDNSANSEKQSVMQEIHKLVSLSEIGAAFERAFRLTFALEYYEQWFKSGTAKRFLSPSAEDVNLAKRRWLACKNRLGETQDGAKGDKHKNEAQQFEREWKLPIDHEPRYPELGPITELNIRDLAIERSSVESTLESIEEKNNEDLSNITANFELAVGKLKLRANVLIRKQRIVITKIDTEDQVTCGSKQVSSDDVSVKQIDDILNAKVWMIDEWNIKCEIESHDGCVLIRLRANNDIPIFGIEMSNI
jgi:hypothetical protein